jgi:hypothetical protein
MMDSGAVYRLVNKSEFEQRDAIEAMASKSRTDARALRNSHTVVIESGVYSQNAYSFEKKAFPIFKDDLVDVGYGPNGSTDIVYHMTVPGALHSYQPASEAEAHKIESARAASKAVQRTYLQLTRAHNADRAIPALNAIVVAVEWRTREGELLFRSTADASR